MSYKNDSMLVIMNKYNASKGDISAEFFETYDKIRDLTVSGPSTGGSGAGTFANWLTNIARYIAPTSFMSVLGNQSINIPGTSYYSSPSVGNSVSSFGNLGNMKGFPSGFAAGIGSDGSSAYGIGGQATGYASALDVASSVSTPLDFAGAAMGTGSGYTGFGSNWVLPAAGVISGIGGIMQAVAPYAGPFGIAANVFGNLTQGYGGSILAAYQSSTQNVLNNADTILTNKVQNLEAISKMLGAQSDVIKKMLKDKIEADGKIAQDL